MEPLAADAEADVRSALAAVARARVAALPLPEEAATRAGLREAKGFDKNARGSPRDALLQAFVAEKRRVLERSAAALTAQ